MLAILAVTEAIADALDRKTPIYLLALDVKKAFDVVRHDSLCHKLYSQMDPFSWKFIKQNLKTSAQVRLQGDFGTPFTTEQGVGQGKILSTHCYKNYINNLLDILSESAHGYCIGSTFL